ncbi:MAG: hypothetical protein ACLQFR_07655, partial [Streptosporangiaceae bacterium]
LPEPVPAGQHPPSSYLPDGTWRCGRDGVTQPCGVCGGCRDVQAENRATQHPPPAGAVVNVMDVPMYSDNQLRAACAQAAAAEREAIVRQLARFRFHDECKRGDDCPQVYHCGVTLPLPGGRP